MLRRTLNIGHWCTASLQLALLFSIYQGPELENYIWMDDLGTTSGPRCTGLRPSGTLSSIRSPNWIPFLRFQTGMKKEVSVVRGWRACGEGEFLNRVLRRSCFPLRILLPFPSLPSHSLGLSFYDGCKGGKVTNDVSRASLEEYPCLV